MRRQADLQRLISHCPPIHRAETEIIPVSPKNRHDHDIQVTTHGIDPSLIDFLVNTIKANHSTIETGCGISTIVFAVLARTHLIVTPNHEETKTLRGYLQDKGVNTDKLTVINGDSVDHLPLIRGKFDVGLVDGKHAFPWPVIDWFYISDRLAIGGIIILDDTNIRTIRFLDNFLKSDRKNWLAISRGKRWSAWQKTGDLRNSIWHTQPLHRDLMYFAKSIGRPLVHAARKLVTRGRGNAA